MRKFEIHRVQLEDRELLSYEEGSDESQSVYRVNCRALKTFHYKIGDSLGVLPKNSPDVVDSVLHSLKASSTDSVQFSNKSISFSEFLRCHADLTKISKKLRILFPDLNAYEGSSLLNFLSEQSVNVSFQEFADALCPLLPRFYSLVSIPEVSCTYELLVRLVSGSGKLQYGICSSFLCKHLQLKEIFSAFIQPTQKFTLTPQMFGQPIVMIGAGTGIAPFKGFVQKRLYDQDPGENVLFFGERYQKNFYYRSFWEKMIFSGRLKLFTAFSREQEKKVYVQDLLDQQASFVRDLASRGAIFFICGKKVLSKEIRVVLENILGRDSFEQLKQSQRYLVDVY